MSECRTNKSVKSGLEYYVTMEIRLHIQENQNEPYILHDNSYILFNWYSACGSYKLAVSTGCSKLIHSIKKNRHSLANFSNSVYNLYSQ